MRSNKAMIIGAASCSFPEFIVQWMRCLFCLFMYGMYITTLGGTVWKLDCDLTEWMSRLKGCDGLLIFLMFLWWNRAGCYWKMCKNETGRRRVCKWEIEESLKCGTLEVTTKQKVKPWQAVMTALNGSRWVLFNWTTVEIYRHLGRPGLIRESLHGFLRGRSCLTNLSEFFSKCIQKGRWGQL